MPLKMESCHDANFVISAVTASCHFHNLNDNIDNKVTIMRTLDFHCMRKMFCVEY